MALQALATEIATAQDPVLRTAVDPAVDEAEVSRDVDSVKQAESSATAAEQASKPQIAEPTPKPHSDQDKQPDNQDKQSGDQAKQPSTTESEPQVPNQLDVICADTQGTLKLDFGKMRCIILYRGMFPAAG